MGVLHSISVACPDANRADLRAQIAANEQVVEELLAMVDHFGLDVVTAYMGHVRRNARSLTKRGQFGGRFDRVEANGNQRTRCWNDVLRAELEI